MIKGFILAAGFSKRLRPITDHIPKPLLPIAGEVLLEYVYNLLKSSGIDQITINLHYKAEDIERYIKDKALPLKIFYEKEILDTGGALYNAKDFLKDSLFIVHNADIYWDGNIKEAINWHINSENDITLLVHDHKPDNKLIIDEEKNLININSAFTLKPSVSLAFTGVTIYSPHVLELLPTGPSSVIDLWFKAKAKGLKVKVFPAKYSFWYDIGTPISYARAVFDNLKRNFTSIYIHPTSSGCELIDIEGNIVIERNVKIKRAFKGKNLIILPETKLSQPQQISDCIICKDFTVSISGWQGQEENLTYGGSARRYFRKQNKVFCEWDNAGEDFEKTVILGNFLKQKGFPIPEIIDVNKEKKLILFEDLGDLTLYSWLQCKRNNEEIINVYRKIIEHIANLHWKISSEVSELKILLSEFDYAYFRWESDYFLKECVKGVFKFDLSAIENKLREELHLLADKLSKSKKVILHRDLQSQNIMLKTGKVYFVDYQSARWGPAAYDIASLLWDPYVNLSDEIRQELVNFYIEKSLSLQTKSFTEELLLCRVQRHMQALGAYGFLSLKKDKRNFLQFIPSALNLLYQDIEECPLELSNLRELVLKLINLINYSFC